MFRIRRVWDDVLPVNRRVLDEIERILGEQLPGVSASEVGALRTRLHDPFRQGLRPLLMVAEGRGHKVLGFASILHDPGLRFAYLEFIATGRKLTRGGIGGALYDALRDEVAALDCRALFFECQPDDLPADTPGLSAEERRANAARLRFYESWDARPLVGTDYQAPLDPSDPSPMPFLVADRLGQDAPLDAAWMRKVVRAILEKKYGHLCPPEYVERVVRSIRGPHVELRPPRYRVEERKTAAARRPLREPIPLVVNDRHEIHHVRERGYVESPVRVGRILAALEPTGWFERVAPREYPLAAVKAVHDARLVDYLRRASKEVGDRESVYPYVFPIRNRARLPRERSVLAGYYCIDTFTPIHRNSYPAAKRAVDCTLTAADALLEGSRLAYALVRPPGHHAERECFGGFCYFCNAAVAAHRLSEHGRIAILDVDYHHGNGQQDIFWRRADVLTVSIHGHPSFAYPYFTGFEEERGEGEGEGFNLNLPQPERLDGPGYRKALRQALDAVSGFAPTFLVVSLGLDPAKGDPTGTWSLEADDFRANGAAIAELKLPTLVVQEGGYRTRTLGANARAFFAGLGGASTARSGSGTAGAAARSAADGSEHSR